MRGRRTAAVLLLATVWRAAVGTTRTRSRTPGLRSRRTLGEGGFALVLDGHSGSALQAVAPIDVEGVRITVRDLRKPDARRLVGAYVTADTGR